MDGKNGSGGDGDSKVTARKQDKPQNFDRARWRVKKMDGGQIQCLYCGHWFRKDDLDRHTPCPNLKLHDQRVQAFNEYQDTKSLNEKESKIVTEVTEVPYDDDAELASRKRGRVGFVYGKGPMLVKKINRKA